jgi:HEPN domain-containing protein
MMSLTQEWVDIAEEDFIATQREYRARKNPTYRWACFHAQQCAEKYLKARLQEAGISFQKTHNLTNLLNLVLTVEPTWVTLHPKLQALNTFAVDVRYPGHPTVTKQDAKQALNYCKEVRQYVRQSLGLP